MDGSVGMPHTDQLHTIERITRLDFNTLDYSVTVEDPGVYTAPWTSGFTKTWRKGRISSNTSVRRTTLARS